MDASSPRDCGLLSLKVSEGCDTSQEASDVNGRSTQRCMQVNPRMHVRRMELLA